MDYLSYAFAIILDLAAIIASFVAAWFWYQASKQVMHRVTIHEEFDYHDLNRVIVAFNRSGIRNRRAALASAIAAALIGFDLAYAHYVFGG
jgi:hypothetical protein